MTYKLHRDGVITGALNCFCLACDLFLDTQHEAAEHIETSEHEKRMRAVKYCDKFGLEHIRKFKWGYYCEFCNVLMPIAAKVIVHITGHEHKHNKGILLLKSMKDHVLAFNNTAIEAKAWHGLIDGVCSLCNAEFGDEDQHKADASHSLNLVQKPIQFGAENAIYRHLDDTSVQCLTCNKLLAPVNMSKHLDDTEHHELYAKHRTQIHHEIKENCQGIAAQDKATNGTSVTKNDDEFNTSKIHNGNGKNENSSPKDKSKLLESIAKYQRVGININLETESAFCKKCSKPVKFDYTEIENHVEHHTSTVAEDSELLYPSTLDQTLNRVDINDKTTKTSDDNQNTEIVNDFNRACRDKVQNDTPPDENNASDKEDTDVDSTSSNDFIPTGKRFDECGQDEEARDFAKANKLTFNEGNNQSFCRVCEVHVPASLRSLKEHVEGANHKKNAGCSVTRPKTPRHLVKQSTGEFIDEAHNVQGPLYTASIINEEFCIYRNSLHLITEKGSRMRCTVCDVNVPPFSGIDDHSKTRQHMTKLLTVPIITSEKDEFIREVRPGLFHCGYCHLIVAGWADMTQHLDCSDHRVNRSLWENRLRFHLPDLHRFKLQQRMEAIALMKMFGMLH